MLGIGVITYNRLSWLQRCVAAVRQHTQEPFVLVVADDGSTDGTADWCRGEGVPVVTGPNRGCAFNKNRALLYLMDRTAADPLVLVEDDTPPVGPWAEPWVAAAKKWGHVNICYGWRPRLPPPGNGTPDDPYWCNAFGGQFTVTTRAALERVGYLDTRFRGYGAEHVEWSWRFARELGKELDYRNGKLPCLSESSGVPPGWGPTAKNEQQERANWSRYWAVANDPAPRLPAYAAADLAAIRSEVAAG